MRMADALMMARTVQSGPIRLRWTQDTARASQISEATWARKRDLTYLLSRKENHKAMPTTHDKRKGSRNSNRRGECQPQPCYTLLETAEAAIDSGLNGQLFLISLSVLGRRPEIYLFGSSRG